MTTDTTDTLADRTLIIARQVRERLPASVPNDACSLIAISGGIVMELLDKYALPCERPELLHRYDAHIETEFSRLEEVDRKLRLGLPDDDGFVNHYIQHCPPSARYTRGLIWGFLIHIAFRKWAFYEQILPGMKGFAHLTEEFESLYFRRFKFYPVVGRLNGIWIN